MTIKNSMNYMSGTSLPQQNYIETIAELVVNHGHAHPAEIAKALNVKKPSVTEAVSRLVDLGLARRLGGSEVVLTAAGALIGRDLANRHEVLRRFMVDVLDIDFDDADEAACRIEHAASAEFVTGLMLFEEFLQKRSSVAFKKQWLDYLKDKRGK